MMRARHMLGGALALLLGACASAPMHYYTLIAPVADNAAHPASGTLLQFELLPVGVPTQDDQPQLVVRQGGQGIAILDSERWIAPLGDEVRGALSADLARALHAQDVTGLPDNGKPVLRIKLDLRRFDSEPGNYALIDAAWSLRLPGEAGRAVLACSSRISESVGPGYDALVQGHQRALAQLAERIAATARSYAAGQPAGCPNGG
jgi:uncharacterized protein